MLSNLFKEERNLENIGLIEKIKGFLFNPTESFKKIREESFEVGLKYFIVLLLIQSALNAVVITAMWGTLWGALTSAHTHIPILQSIYDMGLGIITLLMFVFFAVMSFIGIFISGAIVHLGVLLFGGERGYKETVKAIIYGSTPGYLFGWIPGISIIFWLWALILEIIGIKELQDLSIGRAIAAILIPIIIIIGIIVVIIIIIVFSFVVSYTGGGNLNTILFLNRI